ncbi:hypothetical protein IFM89_031359 [Coptis chinensis]|uniref:GRF-type domain-containing protein n=1 Tax=Coptis chinensis TaxID=261450 RepID=A0A835J0X0_9MAGN|nr:hypothetical protein IFM89_031359 [Coptis chinensis]
MGGGEEGESSQQGGCFLCADRDHMKRDYRWLNYLCVLCKSNTMTLFFCKQGKNTGKRFLRCKSQPKCIAFKWIDLPDEELNEARHETLVKSDKVGTEGGKVKVTVEGTSKLTVEGSVEDVCALVKSLGFAP